MEPWWALRRTMTERTEIREERSCRPERVDPATVALAVLNMEPILLCFVCQAVGKNYFLRQLCPAVHGPGVVLTILTLNLPLRPSCFCASG